MKRNMFVCVAVATLAFASGVRADGVSVVVPDCGVSVTNTATTSQLNGFLDTVQIVLATAYTGTVTITRPGVETVLTASAISSTNNVYRPRCQPHNVVGAAIGGGTNDYERVYLSAEKLQVTVTSVHNTNDVTLRFKIIPGK
jgi:hypothetical protein